MEQINPIIEQKKFKTIGVNSVFFKKKGAIPAVFSSQTV
jgi:hypothetical protein